MSVYVSCLNGTESRRTLLTLSKLPFENPTHVKEAELDSALNEDMNPTGAYSGTAIFQYALTTFSAMTTIKIC
jgi:hypothetical protein